MPVIHPVIHKEKHINGEFLSSQAQVFESRPTIFVPFACGGRSSEDAGPLYCKLKDESEQLTRYSFPTQYLTVLLIKRKKNNIANLELIFKKI